MNKNTKRNILEKEIKLEDDYNYDNNTDDVITFKGYDMSEGFKNEDGNSLEFSEEA